MDSQEPLHDTATPASLEDLERWIVEELQAPEEQKAALAAALGLVFERQRRLWQESKHDAIQALSSGFAHKAARLHSQILAKEATVSNVARYFEEIVADLTEKANRDPKTKLMNFNRFMERLESYLAIEQRATWCAAGVVDITAFKWYNDTLGHALGDRLIDRVARLLDEQIRSRDLIAKDVASRDLHARFGGDEFSFLLTDLPGVEAAVGVAERFRRAVASYAWYEIHPRLANRPVVVDVGIVCLRLGPLEERRGAARALAEQLVHWADQLMYGAKGSQADRVYRLTAAIERGQLRKLEDDEHLVGSGAANDH
jgi:diguanylate cyclase (GGDEF)-like protein